VIDCPPRFSTATIAALCAGTHFVVPSIADASSLAASSNFFAVFDSIVREMNPLIEVLGLAPMMTRNQSLSTDEQAAIDEFVGEVSPAGRPIRVLQNILTCPRIFGPAIA
jgi:cellulose biosynthesis protein BcsQ